MITWLKSFLIKTWWIPVADGKMVLRVLMSSVYLSVDICMVDLRVINLDPLLFNSILSLRMGSISTIRWQNLRALKFESLLSLEEDVSKEPFE
jgi:hypothetical protein